MKRALVLIALLAIIGAVAFFSWPASLEAVSASPSLPKGRALVERGRYLVTAGDCAVCHTDKDGQPFAGGRAFVLPFGTIYSSNITPDTAAGIGLWSDAEFVRALRHGVRDDGRDLYPAFPYTSYSKLSTDDMLAIRAYLNTLPPVAQSVRPNQLMFPFDQRWLMRGWKLLFLRAGTMTPDASRSAEWNRGAWLVEALGHCGECPPPRNLLYGLDNGRKLGGEVVQGWRAYNITPDAKTGIGGWSAADIAAYLSTGHRLGRGVANGPMGEAVEASLSKLPASDLAAIATYLKSLPPVDSGNARAVDPNPTTLASATPWSPGEPSGDLGRRIFEGACAGCHAFDGGGRQTPWAMLKATRAANDPDGTNLVQVVLRGSRIRTPEGSVFMPAFGHAYTDGEVAAVANYVIGHFGGRTGRVTPAKVSELRASE